MRTRDVALKHLESTRVTILARARQTPLDRIPEDGGERHRFARALAEGAVPPEPKAVLDRIEVDADEKSWTYTLVWKTDSSELLETVKSDESESLWLSFAPSEMRSCFSVERCPARLSEAFESHRSSVQHHVRTIAQARHTFIEDVASALRRLLNEREDALETTLRALQRQGVKIVLAGLG